VTGRHARSGQQGELADAPSGGCGAAPPNARLTTLLLGTLVAIVVLSSAIMAVVPSVQAREDWLWGPSSPMTTTQLFRVRPRTHVILVDEEIYLGTLDGMRRGAGFYQAQHDILNANPGRWNTSSPLTYRQPLLTYLWLMLGSGALIGIAWGALASLSMLAAYRAAIRFVRPPFALLSPGALCLVYTLMAIHPPRLLYAEMWAAPLLVTAGALCALVLVGTAAATATTRARFWLLDVFGATSALFALLVRELALVAVAVMLLALLLDGAARRRRLWLPWAAAVAAWLATYAVHADRVKAVSREDPAPPVMAGSLLGMYIHPGLAFVLACVRWVSTTPVLVPVVIGLCACAVAGAPTLRRTGLLVLNAGLTSGVLALLVVSGTYGTFPDGSYTGYWGFLFLPVVVAWAPLGLRLLARTHTRADI